VLLRISFGGQAAGDVGTAATMIVVWKHGFVDEAMAVEVELV